MKYLSKSEIIKMSHTTFYVWTKNIDPLKVTKKELKKSLKHKNYGCDLTECGTISYGKRKGWPWMSCVILIG